MPILHPGGLSLEERQNLEGVDFNPPVKQVFFEFNITNLHKAKEITVLPKNSLIISPVFIRIVNTFNGTSPVLLLGLDADRDVGVAFVGNSGVVNFIPDVTNDTRFLVKTPKESTLHFVIFEFGQTVPTRGDGWALLQYVDLNLLGVK